MTPTVLQTVYHFSPTIALQANSLAIVFLSFGCIGSGVLADRFGAGRVFVFGSALLLITSWTFYHSLFNHPDWLFPLYALSEIGRASCRESVCNYVYILVVAVSLKQKRKKTTTK